MLKGLIVSCQAVEGEPLFGYNVMGIMAKAAVEGGATAIRTSGIADIEDIKKNVSVPVIGLIKKKYNDSEIYITPTLNEVKMLCESSCEVIALDMTNRIRPNNEKVENLIKYIRENYQKKQIMADIATEQEAINAEKLGVDYVSTTLSGYTNETKNIKIPSYKLIKSLKKKLNIKVIAEGGIWETRDLKKIKAIGVDTVVIGTAITRPKDITKRFNKVLLG